MKPGLLPSPKNMMQTQNSRAPPSSCVHDKKGESFDQKEMKKNLERVKNEVNPGKFVLQPAKEFERFMQRQTLNRWYNRGLASKKLRVQIAFGVMQKVCSILEFGTATFALGVHIFDAVISKFPVESKQMTSLGLVSVVLASKMNEPHYKLISLKDVSEFLIPKDVKELAAIERKVFSALGFRLNLVTPQEILNFLLHLFFLPENRNFFLGENASKEKGVSFLTKVQTLSLLTLVDYTFYKYTSVAVAVSILIHARKLTGLEAWPVELEKFTSIKEDHVSECLRLIEIRTRENFLARVFSAVDQQISKETLEIKRKSFISDSTLNLSGKFFVNNQSISTIVGSAWKRSRKAEDGVY